MIYTNLLASRDFIYMCKEMSMCEKYYDIKYEKYLKYYVIKYEKYYDIKCLTT